MKCWLLILGEIFNLVLLGYFKFAVLMVENAALALGESWSIKPVVLHLVISFFIFQKIAYLVDCNKNEVVPPPFSTYLLFIFFFPQLIARPIVHQYEILPQLENLGRKGDRFFVSGRHKVFLCRPVQEGNPG